jgi:ribonuclease D
VEKHERAVVFALSRCRTPAQAQPGGAGGTAAVPPETGHQKDRPLFKVFSNTSLLKIATEMADSPRRWSAPAASATNRSAFTAKALAGVVKKAKAIPANKLPVYPRKRRPKVSPRVPDRIKAIKTWRDRMTAQLELDPALLFNKALMTAIAVKKPSGIGQLREVDGIRNWQVKAFGTEIIKVLAGVP